MLGGTIRTVRNELTVSNKMTYRDAPMVGAHFYHTLYRMPKGHDLRFFLGRTGGRAKRSKRRLPPKGA